MDAHGTLVSMGGGSLKLPSVEIIELHIHNLFKADDRGNYRHEPVSVPHAYIISWTGLTRVYVYRRCASGEEYLLTIYGKFTVHSDYPVDLQACINMARTMRRVVPHADGIQGHIFEHNVIVTGFDVSDDNHRVENHCSHPGGEGYSFGECCYVEPDEHHRVVPLVRGHPPEYTVC